jgi:DNA-binding Lrp family transcriptional regulator
MAEQIHLDEVLAELGRLERTATDGPAGFTSREVARALSCSNSRAQGRLREWFDRGLIEHAGRRNSTRMDGAATYTPVYRLVAKAKSPRRPRA